MRILALLLLLSFLGGNACGQKDEPAVALLALRTDDKVLALASCGGKALAGEALEFRFWPLRAPRRTEIAHTDATGLAVLDLPADLEARTPILVLRGTRSCAVAAIEIARPNRLRTANTVHLMLDRPVFRPGETVQGRVVLRHHEFCGADRNPEARPLGAEPIEITLRLPGERRLQRALSTDLLGNAAFAFPLPDDLDPGQATVEIRHREVTQRESAFEVRAYRRPSVRCRMDLPIAFRPGSALTVDMHATFSAGGPAPRQKGLLTVAHSLGIPVTLDVNGFARVVVPAEVLAGLGARTSIPLQLEILGPEGVAARAEELVVLRDVPRAPDTARVGEKLVVRVRGTPADLGIVCIAHDRLLASRVVTLDRDGEGVAEFDVLASWCPRVEVFGAGNAGAWMVFDQSASRPFSVAVADQLSVRLVESGRRFAPGAKVTLNIETVDRMGTGKPTTLAVAVVDEQVFAAFADRTRDPCAALAPLLDREAVRKQTTLVSSCRGLALSELSLAGRLEGWPALASREPRARGAGASTPGPSGPALVPPPPRSRFEATAGFVAAVRTDTSGRAAVEVQMPDDTTTWRVTIVAVDSGATASLHRTWITTEKELSIDAALPRFLREGDEIVATSLVHHGKRAVTLMPLRLRGLGSSPLPIDLEVREGELFDSLHRSLPVLPPVSWVPWSTTLVVTNQGAVVPPEEADPSAACELLLLPGRDAILAEAARYVGEYPFGCVEQTTSRLLPHLVAMKLHPKQDQERRAKITAGLLRLRMLLVAKDRGFRYWPGWAAVDRRMTAYAVHALCLAREVGIDLEHHGLVLRPEDGEFAALLKRIAKEGTKVGSDDLDLGIALARFAGEQSAAAHSLAGLVAAPDLQPRHLVALALTLAPQPAARAIARALGEIDAGTLRPAELAMLLLALRKRDGSAEDIARLERRLLELHCDGRFGTTFDTAMAIVALSRAGAPATSSEPFVVEIAQGDSRKRVRLGAEAVRMPLASALGITVHPEGGRTLIAVLRGKAARLGRAETPALGAMRVTRRLLDLESGAEVRRFLVAGRPVKLVIEVSAEHAVDYVAVDCPIPAGFEVLGTSDGWEVHDDRAAFAFSGVHRNSLRAELTLVPAFTGAVAWPATIATAMYDPRRRGATPPERLLVLGS